MKYAIISLSTFLLVSCGESAPTATESIQETVNVSEPQNVDSTVVADATSGATSVAKMTNLNGILVVPPQNRASVTLPMGGIVKNMTLLPGAYVEKGQLIATIENPEFITLQQNYLDSYAQTEYLETEYQRQKSLAQQEAASQKKLQQSKADFLSMKSRKDAASAQLTLLGVSTASILEQGIQPYITVKSPISGYISDMKMNTGKYFDAGEPLCEITNKSVMLLKLVAYEKELSKLKIGELLEFRVNGMGMDIFKATITSVGQQIDATNRSLEVYAMVNTNNGLFRPGMYVTASISRN